MQPDHQHRPLSVTTEGVVEDIAGEWERFSTAVHRCSDEDGVLSRHDIQQLGKNPDPASVQQLLQVLLYEAAETTRVAAIKALAIHGGDAAISALEEIVAGEEPSAKGKQAAQKGLADLGLFRGDAPLLNQRQALDAFVHLATQYDAAEALQWGSPRSISVQNFPLLKYIPWTPWGTEKICLSTTDSFSVSAAANRAEKAGLIVRTHGEDMVGIEGDSWPGFGSLGNSPYLLLGFVCNPSADRASLLIYSQRLPPETGITDWFGAVNVLVRLSRWLGGEEQGTEDGFRAPGVSESEPEADQGDQTMNFLNFIDGAADDLGPTDPEE